MAFSGPDRRGAIAAYMLLSRVSELAQGAFICVRICPTATAAPVVTGMLGGSVPRVATHRCSATGGGRGASPLPSWINSEPTCRLPTL